MKLFTRIALIIMVLANLRALAVDPVVTVRFANPEFNCTNQSFNVDVEFQCNVPDKQLYSMNVRFYYPCDLLTFDSFGEFVAGYGLTNGVPPTVNQCDSATGINFFTFPGAAVYVNGAIKKTGITSLKLSTTGWTKIFNMNFYVIDTNAFNSSSFCPSLIWDLKEDLSGGFIPGNSGVVIALTTSNAIEHVQQFNWQYDGIPGEPYGFPTQTSCISTICGYAPKSILPTFSVTGPGQVSIPVKVVDFDTIGAFRLAFDYNSTILNYEGDTVNSIFNSTNGLMTVTNTVDSGGIGRITMVYDGLPITLADSANLAIFSFDPSGGVTPLTWITDGNTCKYFNSIDYPLLDQPYPNYYTNGNIDVASLGAPVTKIDSITAIQGDLVTFSVKVWDYLNISSGSLTLDFNPTVLSFYQAIPNLAVASGFTCQVIGTGRLEMNWAGNDTTLADGSILTYLVFSNIGGISSLTWYDTGATCQYISSITNGPLNDEPTCEFYVNGNVAPSEFVWTGEISNDWNTNENWEYDLVPDQFTDVVINTSGSRTTYPTFNGDFTLGVHCKNLTVVGSAQLIITGNLTIEPGHTLEMTGAGGLHVGGNWTNSGIFIPGTGVVDFAGTSDASISAGVPPQNYVAAYILTEFTQGMTQITGGSAGPTGNDAHSDASLGFTFKYLGVDYTQVRINTNGWLSFNLSGDDADSYDNIILFDTRTPTTVLAPWWDNLNADGTSAISYKTEGTAPTRVFTAEWKHILAYSTGSTVRLNFQVKLYEGSNIIEFCYGDLETGTHNCLEGASIGIKDAAGGQGNFLEATHNSTVLILPCLSSAIDWPASNYRYTPPVPNAMDTFYKLMITKTVGELSVQRDVKVTGQE